MAEDLSSAVNMLKSVLGDNADEKIKAVLSSLSDNSQDTSSSTAQPQSSSSSENSFSLAQSSSAPSGGFDENTMKYLMKMKNVIDEMSHGDDRRSNLLMSLRPYMRAERQQSIDNALRLLTLTRLSGILSSNGLNL